MNTKADDKASEWFEQSFYRTPWSKEKVQYVVNWFPHFGTYIIADELGIARQQVKSKVDQLKLKMLPKSKRLCPKCRVNFQMENYDSGKRSNAMCKQCHLEWRKEKKRLSPQPTKKQWMQTLLNTKKYQQNFEVKINLEYLLELWESQNGLCWYSGFPMVEPQYGRERNLFTASIDRRDSNLGYIKGNVVWATWICNVGKNSFSELEYIQLCAQVTNFQQEKLKSAHDK